MPEKANFDPVQLIEQHQAGIWRYLRAIGCEAAEADDITQETFITVLERPFEQISPAATGAFLRTVARNLFISARRRDGRLSLVDNIDHLDLAWKDWVRDDDGSELLDILRECLKQLTERARWALEMRFRDQLPRAEIAAALEITEHGAKNLMQRAKQQLQACIERKVK